ncbi:hypothetical protein Patl1_08116 [Pistacia atlantica]|uniref:Uncharacterized protein n=1 Tax=Pistacia atlantica TaxID=434234 RepID=A0ACC1AIZ5_9ROSI|nr:hypothetical protein Patl1_08116 [Pistacia atlantica]
MLTKVPHTILGENNYTSWAVCMKNYLTGEGLWQIVDGSEPKDQNDDQSTLKTWEKHNAKALHAIQVSCSSIMFSYISMEKTAKAVWDRLASIHRWHDHIVASQAELTLDKQGISANAGTFEDTNIPYMVLYHAAVNGDQRSIEKFFGRYPETVSARIATDGGTALHTAALHRHDNLVELLVPLMPQEDLELRTTSGATALHIAATGKSVEMAEAMVKKNKKLLSLKDDNRYIPVCIAALYGDKRMLRYLYSETSAEELNPETSFALSLLERFPKLAITRDVKGRICLNVLAQKRSSFPSGSQLSRWQRWIYRRPRVETVVTTLYDEGSTKYRSDRLTDLETDSDDSGQSLALRWKKGLKEAAYELLGINYISQLKLKHRQATGILILVCREIAKLNSTQHLQSLVMPSMFQATESGNVEFVTEMIRFDPALLWSRTEMGGIFHAAVAQRQEKIWNLIYETEEKRDLASIEDNFDNNILHIAGMLAPVSHITKIPGPAMQMQRELQWFKEVENIVRPMLREQQNREGKTPRALFSEQHKALANEGKKWMKDTATSCLLVATLIATVMFEAAIHIPGGSGGGIWGPKTTEEVPPLVVGSDQALVGLDCSHQPYDTCRQIGNFSFFFFQPMLNCGFASVCKQNECCNGFEENRDVEAADPHIPNPHISLTKIRRLIESNKFLIDDGGFLRLFPNWNGGTGIGGVICHQAVMRKAAIGEAYVPPGSDEKPYVKDKIWWDVLVFEQTHTQVAQQN